MKFRTDINGLRTYAVLAVIIFHFNKSWLPGGFAGVDVFFVISGYLMTSIIFRGLEKKSFSLWKFYSARIRRIIPALLVLIIILMVFGYLFLAPIPYADLAKHSGGSLLFISNIMYWQESGYFDASALEKFLLHTWSLSVEWQFYMIYPIALIVLAKIFSIKTLKKILLVGTILAFLFAAYASFKWSVASYFLLPSRIWEMLLGGIVFLYPLQLSKTRYKHALELTGLALVVISFFIISENAVWPGYMALIPTLGAFILLQANNEKSIFTNNPIAQKIGLWSYSLYLYHWPILVINHKFDLQLSVWTFMLITIVFSIASYYMVEIKRWKVSHVLIALLIGLTPIITVYKTDGAGFRVEEKHRLTATEYHLKYYGGIDYPTFVKSQINPANREHTDFIMIGDSFSRQYARYLTDHNFNSTNFFTNGCFVSKGLVNLRSGIEYELCENFSNDIFKENFTELPEAPIIWIQNWNEYLVLSDKSLKDRVSFVHNYDLYAKRIEDEVLQLQRNFTNSKNIFIIGQTQQAPSNTSQCLANRALLGQRIFNDSCDSYFSSQDLEINSLLKNIADKYPSVYFIDPNRALCPKGENKYNCLAIVDGEPVFSDQHHLSIYGAEVVGKYIFDEIKQKNH